MTKLSKVALALSAIATGLMLSNGIWHAEAHDGKCAFWFVVSAAFLALTIWHIFRREL